MNASAVVDRFIYARRVDVCVCVGENAKLVNHFPCHVPSEILVLFNWVVRYACVVVSSECGVIFGTFNVVLYMTHEVSFVSCVFESLR